MTVTAITARVEEIQQMIGSLKAHGAPSGSGDFATALQSATSSAPTSSAPSAIASAASTPTAFAAAGSGAATSLNTPYASEITAAATKYGLDPALLAGLVRQESNFNPTAGSPAGARGLTQLMPGTAASLGVTDVTDPVQALDGGAKYLKQQLDAFKGDEKLALAAYNAGPGAVSKFGGIPPYAETQNYVTKVLGYAQEYRAAGATAATAAPAIPAGVPTTSMSTPTPQANASAGALSYSTS